MAPTGWYPRPVPNAATTNMVLRRFRVYVHRGGLEGHGVPGARSAFSLHNHTAVSREKLDFVPAVARCIPWVAPFFEAGLERYLKDHGRPLDFDELFWRPPLEPAAVLASEAHQIEDRLGLEPQVALTDHDTIDAWRGLRATSRSTPAAVEWTLPYDGTVFHLGIHNLPPARAEQAMAAMAACTAGGRPLQVGQLLAWLAEPAESFIVLNHPFWDLAEIGDLRHESVLLGFVRRYRRFLHGLELNGYRRWSENQRVLPLAEGFGLPVVCGGDRHGRLPNMLLNVSAAPSWDEFATDLRAGRGTDCLILPEYREPFAARILEGVRDALEPNSGGDARWLDRVFLVEDGIEKPLSAVWPHGGPWWLRITIAMARALGATPMRPFYRLALATEQAA